MLFISEYSYRFFVYFDVTFRGRFKNNPDSKIRFRRQWRWVCPCTLLLDVFLMLRDLYTEIFIPPKDVIATYIVFLCLCDWP